MIAPGPGDDQIIQLDLEGMIRGIERALEIRHQESEMNRMAIGQAPSRESDDDRYAGNQSCDDFKRDEQAVAQQIRLSLTWDRGFSSLPPTKAEDHVFPSSCVERRQHPAARRS